MIIKLLLGSLSLAICSSLSGSYTITGKYLDKNPNPIADANVYLIHNGDTVSRGITDETGNFNLLATSTSINSEFFNTGSTYPNPFSETVHFTCDFPSNGGEIYIINASGVIFNQYSISFSGSYKFRWGGLTGSGNKAPAGIYYIFSKTNGRTQNITKIIYLGSHGHSGLNIVSDIPISLKKAGNDSKGGIDTILFLKKNTTPLFYAFSNEEQDLDLGQITGNPGPTVIDEEIPVQTLLEDETLMLYLDPYVHNDELYCNMIPRNPKFTYYAGLLNYTSDIITSDETWVDIIDINDPTLKDSLFVKVLVESKWSKVTFIFKSATDDTVFFSGTSTIKYRLMNQYGGGFEWTEDSVKTSENGYVKLRMLKKRTYDINGLQSKAINDFYGTNYIFFKRNDDLEAFEQRARDENTSPINFNSEYDTINVYKLVDEYLIWSLIEICSKLNGINIGIRKFSKNDVNAPAWWDGNYVASIPIQRQWIDEIRADLQSIPHVYLNLPFIESTETPTVPHLRIAVSDAFPAPGTNGTGYDPVTNCITVGDARYPVVYSQYSEYTFKIEILQAIGDLNDIGGGDPPIMEVYGDDKRRLNTLGKQIFAVMFLAQPKTKF